jgi:Fe-S cluster assembly protein SufD
MTSEVRKLQEKGSLSDWASIAIDDARRTRSAQGSLTPQVTTLVAEAQSTWSKVLFPTPKLEAWKYTNPDVIARGPFILAASSKKPQVNDAEVTELLKRALVQGFDRSSRLVFVDGVFSARHSDVVSESGVVVTRILEESSSAHKLGELGLHREDAFAALATALLTDCVSVSVRSGYSSKAPLEVVHVTTTAAADTVTTPRIHVQAGESSRVTVIESHVGAANIRYLSLPVVELSAGAGACIDYYKIQAESENAFHVAGVTARQSRDAEVRTHIFSFGGALVRNNAQTLLNGSGSRTVLNGLSVLTGSQHVDNATLIHHIEPHAESREHFKGIYGDSSKGVFSGTITVEKIAQKTNAFQSNQALLLSSGASIESRPQLKIWADDVKCTHGATVGQLDADALFYLRSRGVGERQAKAFLVHAFASEVLASVEARAVKEHIETLISAKLERITV